MATNSPELIYCANGNARFAEIAIDLGFTYGAQLPGTVYFNPQFVDQNWKKPNRDVYLMLLKQYTPRMATVLDYERVDQKEEVLEWAEEAARYVTETIIIIPKVSGTIGGIPKIIGGKEIRLGYSVPTKHGGTLVLPYEFYGRDVHLLGGSPLAQKKFSGYMRVVSVDGNMHHKMATQFCAFFDPLKQTPRGIWPFIKDFDGEKWGKGAAKSDAPYEAFRRSCKNILSFWHGGDFLQINDKPGPSQMSFSFV